VDHGEPLARRASSCSARALGSCSARRPSRARLRRRHRAPGPRRPSPRCAPSPSHAPFPSRAHRRSRLTDDGQVGTVAFLLPEESPRRSTTRSSRTSGRSPSPRARAPPCPDAQEVRPTCVSRRAERAPPQCRTPAQRADQDRGPVRHDDPRRLAPEDRVADSDPQDALVRLEDPVEPCVGDLLLHRVLAQPLPQVREIDAIELLVLVEAAEDDVSFPVTGSRCFWRHWAQTSFIMHCIGELMCRSPCARVEQGSSTPWRASFTAAIMRSSRSPGSGVPAQRDEPLPELALAISEQCLDDVARKCASCGLRGAMGRRRRRPDDLVRVVLDVVLLEHPRRACSRRSRARGCRAP